MSKPSVLWIFACVIAVYAMIVLVGQAEDGCNGKGEILRRAHNAKMHDDEMKECLKNFESKYCR